MKNIREDLFLELKTNVNYAKQSFSGEKRKTKLIKIHTRFEKEYLKAFNAFYIQVSRYLLEANKIMQLCISDVELIKQLTTVSNEIADKLDIEKKYISEYLAISKKINSENIEEVLDNLLNQ